MTQLEGYIAQYFGVKQEDAFTIATMFKKTSLEKEAYFTREGKYCQKLSFIITGFMRVYKDTEEKQVTQWISSEGDFITDLSSLMFQTPSRWNIQALTNCELYTISDEDYRQIQYKVPQWPQMEKLFLAKCFLTLEDRVFSFLSMTAEDRFMHLFDYKPALFNQVPLNYIASMLGMTPETLSRIRKKITS